MVAARARSWLRLLRRLLWSLLSFRIRIADSFPQPFQGVGAGLWAESVIRAESLLDGLNHFFVDAIGARFGCPKVEHLCQPADNGRVAVSVLVFETEEFTEFLQG